MNELPFDLREIRSFVSVAESGSYTEAAQLLGISQSALTRQIQGLEEKMGEQLISRTTRSTRLTTAGEFWLKRSREILQAANQSTCAFKERFAEAAAMVRVGVCSTVSLSYLPGFFHAFRRHYPDNQVRLIQGNEVELIQQLDQCEIDVAIVNQPISLPPAIELTHSFEDQFVLIGPQRVKTDSIAISQYPSLPWIAIDTANSTGKAIRDWFIKQGVRQAPMMEFDDVDLIIHSVSLGLGYAIVPRRSLAIYSKNRKIVRYPLATPLQRTLCALARAENNRPVIIQALIDHILF